MKETNRKPGYKIKLETVFVGDCTYVISVSVLGLKGGTMFDDILNCQTSFHILVCGQNYKHLSFTRPEVYKVFSF